MNEFQERYKSYPLSKLVTILVDAENYQPDAVKAAELEIRSRGLSDEQIRMQKEELSNKSKIKAEIHPAIGQVEKKAKKIGGEIYELINPLDQKVLSVKRKIALTAIFVGFLALKNLFQSLIYLKYSLFSYDYEFELMQFSFLVTVVICYGVYLVWKRERVVWISTTAFVACILGMQLFTIVMTLKHKLQMPSTDYSSWYELNDIKELFYNPTPVIFDIVTAAVFFGLLYVLNQQDMKSEFSIDKRTALFAMGSGLVVLLLFFFALSFG